MIYNSNILIKLSYKPSLAQLLTNPWSKLTSAHVFTSKRWLSSADKRTCLFDFHQRRQARMESFAGYSMPIVYKNQTIKSEHLQTRNAASAFDVSHMMQTIIRGRDRCKFIESLTVADIQSIELNKCVLSVFTNDLGGIIDDCIIGKYQDHLHVVSNAGNAEVVWNWLCKNKSTNLDVRLDRLTDWGLIALQGPKAAEVLQTLVKVDLKSIEFMNGNEVNVKNIGDCVVTRCGYTGEDGFEISVPPNLADSLMETLCDDERVKPAGLGARDTLRLEAGLCLHGHDITDKITPVEAALNWVVQKRRRQEGGFPGAKIIMDQLRSGTRIKRVGLIAEQAGPPARENCQIKESNVHIGNVTSGTFAPSLERNIAMAYIPSQYSKELGKTLSCEIRNKSFEYKITKMPFIKSNYYIKQK